MIERRCGGDTPAHHASVEASYGVAAGLPSLPVFTYRSMQEWGIIAAQLAERLTGPDQSKAPNDN